MYSKNAKWKKVAECTRLSDNILILICQSHAIREGYTKFVTADYYWDDMLGLFVVIDTKGKGNILQWYKNYHLLIKNPVPTYELIWHFDRDNIP